MIFEDRELKLHEVTGTLRTSEDNACSTLHEDLSMRELCSKWVPRLLTFQPKQQRVGDSKHCLGEIRSILHTIYDNRWYMGLLIQGPVGSQPIGQQQTEGVRSYVKAKGDLEVYGVRMYVKRGHCLSISCSFSFFISFWPSPRYANTRHVISEKKKKIGEAHVIPVDYLENGLRINSAYYIALFCRMNDEFTGELLPKENEKILLQEHKAPCNKSTTTMAKLHDLRVELFPHQPYSLNLTLNDYHLFANLKKCSPVSTKVKRILKDLIKRSISLCCFISNATNLLV